MKLSVVIPVFNSEKTLERCLNSILNQTYSDWEVIAIDDGSTDESYSILTNYNLKDQRFKILKQSNHGPGFTRNKGIEMSTGDYIVFVDSDDYIDNVYFEKVVNEATSNDSDVIFIDVILEDINGGIIRKEIMSKYKNSTKDRIIRHQMTGKLPWGGCRKVVKTKVIKENNIKYSYDVVGEEALFSFKVINNAQNISFIEDTCYHYVNYENSQSTKGGDNPWGHVCKNMKKYLEENNLFENYKITINSFAYTACIVSIQRISELYNFSDAIKLSKKALDEFKVTYSFNIDKESIDKRAVLMLPFAKLNMSIMIVITAKIKQLLKI